MGLSAIHHSIVGGKKCTFPAEIWKEDIFFISLFSSGTMKNGNSILIFLSAQIDRWMDGPCRGKVKSKVSHPKYSTPNCMAIGWKTAKAFEPEDDDSSRICRANREGKVNPSSYEETIWQPAEKKGFHSAQGTRGHKSLWKRGCSCSTFPIQEGKKYTCRPMLLSVGEENGNCFTLNKV